MISYIKKACLYIETSVFRILLWIYFRGFSPWWCSGIGIWKER